MYNQTHYYNISGFEKYGILIPRDVPPEIVVRMLAALASSELGVKSIDLQLKQYRAIWEKEIVPQHSERQGHD